MTTQEIAQRLVALCRLGKFEEAQQELFAPNAVSIEPYASPGVAKQTEGLPAIMEKGRRFMSMIEQTHALTVSDPIVAGNAFGCMMRLDVTMKGQGRMDMSELCLYQVKEGRIVAEEFRV